MKLIIFASINEAEILSKILQKFYYEWQIVLNFGKNGLSYKLEHRELISQFYPPNLVTCTGDWETVQSLGDSWTSQESGHICYRSKLNIQVKKIFNLG